MPLDHIRHCALERPPDAEQVDPDDALELLIGDQRRRLRRAADPGIGDRHVDAAEALARGGDGAVDRVAIGDVGDEGLGLTADLPAACSTPSASRSISASFAPIGPSRLATSRPMPLPAPVIRTTLPSIS